jgi:hypothetical protein
MNYVIEPLLLNKKLEDSTPDIVASGESGWLIIELTLNSGSKEPKLKKYLSIDPRYLTQHGLYAQNAPPDVISSRLYFIDDGSYGQLVVNDKLEVIKEEHIINPQLRNSLIAMRGNDLKRLPSIPIAFLPEMRADEIRIGLIDTVMQLFKPGSEGKGLVQIVEEGLERLSDCVSITARVSLRDKVKTEMNALVRDVLKGYLIFDGNEGVYKSTDKFKRHPKTMERIALALRDWAGIGPQKTLDSFPDSPVIS